MKNDVQLVIGEIKESINIKRRKKSDAKIKSLLDINTRAKFAKALRVMSRIPFGYRLDLMTAKYDEQIESGVSPSDAMEIAIWEGAKYSDVFDYAKVQSAIDAVRDYNPIFISKLARLRRKHPFLLPVATVLSGVVVGLAVILLFERMGINEAWAYVVFFLAYAIGTFTVIQFSEI